MQKEVDMPLKKGKSHQTVSQQSLNALHKKRSEAAKKAAATRRLKAEEGIMTKLIDAGQKGACSLWNSTKKGVCKIKEQLHI